jgi:hypothetical protein
MATEVIYQDGSMSTFHDDGGSSHTGYGAMDRLRLLNAISALKVYIKWDGEMQLTANGAHRAIKTVIEPMTGQTYKRSMNGKKQALADAIALLAYLEGTAVIYEGED